MKKGGRSKSQPRRKPLARGAGVQRKLLPPMISLRKTAESFSSSDEDDDSGVVQAEIVNSEDEDTEDEDVAPKRGGNRPRPVSERTRSRQQEEAAAALLNLSTNVDDDDDSFGDDDDEEEEEEEAEEAKKAPRNQNQVLNKGRRRMLRRRLVSLEKALNTTWKKGKPWWNNFDLFLVAYNEFAPNKGGKQRAPQKRKKPQVIFFGRNSEASNRVLNTLALRENVDSLKCSISFTHKPNQFMAVLAQVDVSKGHDGTTEDEDDE